jgi:hypothetical protein
MTELGTLVFDMLSEQYDETVSVDESTPEVVLISIGDFSVGVPTPEATLEPLTADQRAGVIVGYAGFQYAMHLAKASSEQSL